MGASTSRSWRARRLDHLADAAYTRYSQSGELKDLEDSIVYNREALILRPPGDPNRHYSLYHVGANVGLRYQELGKIEDLEEAIAYVLKALSLRPPGHPQRSDSLHSLGTAVHIRYTQLGKTEDLEAAIKYHLDAFSLRSPDHPEQSDTLTGLGAALHDRYRQWGKIGDLEEAVTYYLAALTLRPLGHPQRSHSLDGLGAALGERYQQLGKIEDLEEAITYFLEALSLRPVGHPQRSDSLHSLGTAFRVRYTQLGKIEDCEAAVTCHQDALSLRPPGHPERSHSLDGLGAALGVRHQLLGKIEDLEESVTYFLEALSLRPVGHPQYSQSLDRLGAALHNRYWHLGKIEDLEAAIAYILEAVALCPVSHPQHSDSLSNLGVALHDRYQQLDKIEDLEAVITYFLETLSHRPPGHPRRSDSFYRLGIAGVDRFRQSGKIEDLEEAVTYHLSALSLRPPGHSERSSSLFSLGAAVGDRYRQLRKIEDSEAVIAYSLEALSLRPVGHPQRSHSLHILGTALLDRYQQQNKIEDLGEAINYYLEALSLYPVGHPRRSDCLFSLGVAILDRHERFGRIEDLNESLKLLRQAANQSGSGLKEQLAAAKQWASIARDHHDSSVISAYSTFFRLLDHSLIAYPKIASQQKFLATADISAASDAASAAIDAQQLDAAVELLEQGRSILWAKMDGYRQPLDQLRQADVELADRLEKISAEIETFTLPFESQPLDLDRLKTLAHSEGQLRRRRILSKEWDDALAQVRKIDGFGHFLQAIPFATLQKAAAEGPIIIVNISKYRSDAILLLVDGPPILVPLLDVQPEDLTSLSSRFTMARDGRKIAKPSPFINSILRQLWSKIVHPVVDRLRQLEVPERSRIWWCPTSELCGLPLHAAGPYRPDQKNLPDLYTSSYTPTISALIRARSNIVQQNAVPKLLAIGQFSKDLEHVQPEIDGVRELGDFVDVLIGAEASHDTVIDGLRHHSWAHFACHGYLGENGQPYKAAFQLPDDRRLYLLDLIHARLPEAELAFLSMCHSAAGDLTTPNESISLAAALQFCGFRSVVGTLWAMDDVVGPMISKEFYKHMFRHPDNKADFRDSAEALNVAIRALRKSKMSVDRWIMFVHIGA